MCRTALSFVLLVGAMLVWPELFVFRKYLMLPAWTQYLPTPGHAGAYLATLALVPAAWGVRSLPRATGATLAVIAAAPLVAMWVYAAYVPWDIALVFSFAYNYAFMMATRLAAPALALLALRWAVQTWIRL
jgi:hypothetical protein